MNNTLNEWMGVEGEGEWVRVGETPPVPEEQACAYVQHAQVERAVGFIKAKGVRAIVLSVSTGVIVGALNKAGVEVGFPLVCVTLGGTEVGLRLLQKAVAGTKSNGDAKGIAVIRR